MEHILQLFDTRASMVDAVSQFLREGFVRHEAIVVVMSQANWEHTSQRLQARGVHVSEAIAAGHLTVLDAADTLTKISRNGFPDRDRFEVTVGELVHRLRQGNTPVRAYGEMVDLLAAEGNFRAVQQLESLWEELGAREPFTLFCGYSAVHFGDPHTADALRRLCRAHSRVRANPLDPLGAYLLQTTA